MDTSGFIYENAYSENSNDVSNSSMNQNDCTNSNENSMNNNINNLINCVGDNGKKKARVSEY